MRLELFSLDVFLNEIMDRGVKTIYYYYEEYEKLITFTAADGDIILSYVLKETTVTFNKENEIKKLQNDLPGIRFRRGLLRDGSAI